MSAGKRDSVTDKVLRRAVDDCLLSADPSPESEELLRRYSASALRCILERRDRFLLAEALRRDLFPAGLAARMEKETVNLPFPLRLLLTHPEMADSVPPPARAGEKAEAAKPADTEELLSRRQFDAGVALPFLRRAVVSMPRRADRRVLSFGTDGLSFYYRPGAEIGEEDFRHMLMHCIFRHMFPPERADRSLWDLACDMSAEYLREEILPTGKSGQVRYSVTGALPEGCDPRSAISVYRGLSELYKDELAVLRGRFPRDDHRYWYERPERAPALPGSGEGEGGLGISLGEGEEYAQRLRSLLDERWGEIAEALLPKRGEKKKYGLAPGSREEKMLLRQEGKYDFTRYLRRFSILREELQLDESSFDYIPYCYGLERYGNLPLIEPLEYTESFKIAQLVIAIDTSGSCSREVVERFMAETERILMRRENFFRKMDIHIIQCDAIIQEHTVIRTPEDWKRYRSGLTIKGRGGTSFIPVFRLVDTLRSRGELKTLKGLLYFTDGDGAYPHRGPDYDVAFIFPDRESLRVNLPGWITPLCLEP